MKIQKKKFKWSFFSPNKKLYFYFIFFLQFEGEFNDCNRCLTDSPGIRNPVYYKKGRAWTVLVQSPNPNLPGSSTSTERLYLGLIKCFMPPSAGLVCKLSQCSLASQGKSSIDTLLTLTSWWIQSRVPLLKQDNFILSSWTCQDRSGP